MAMTLDQWQERLQSHFSELAAARVYSDYRLFALEHDLGDDEFDEITELLHDDLKRPWRLGRHWLVWVVYATELGYGYDGDEYWSSFEARTPEWRESNPYIRRNQLREWFVKFQMTFQGVKPSGPWAEWFSIIAWPITHAILPRYLQLQFAKNLYELRHRLANLDRISPRTVGELLARNTWDASSRFQQFLEQQELTGRLVLALLSDRTVEGESPIFPQTLARIVADLEEVQSAREWLSETRRTVADRLRGTVRAVGSTQNYHANEYGHDGDATRNRVHRRPTLMLRSSTPKTWSIVVDIPSFSQVAQDHPQLQTLLRRTRCKIAGTGDRWLPAGWLLGTSRRRVFKTWPGDGSILVSFEQSDPELDAEVSQATRLSAGPTWLCRVGNDGIAREIAGRVVRPGHHYILLGEDPRRLRSRLLASCETDCEGIHAAQLVMPDTVSSETARVLQELGLQISRTVQVWPAGLSARGFDGEGRSEWLTTESPCFAIVHDHPVDAYALCLDEGDEIVVRAGGVGVPVFVKLAPQTAGRHQLVVKARQAYAPGLSPSAPVSGVVTLDVRDPEPWIPGTTSHGGLVVSLDAPHPDLDNFWNGHVDFSILGPIGRKVSCTIQLASANGKEILREVVGTLDLPVTPFDWSKRFTDFAKDDDRVWAYLEASSGKLIVSGEELGEYSVRLERDVTPLRWVCGNVGRETRLRLIDDSGTETPPVCRVFNLRTPVEADPLDPQVMLSGIDVVGPGGLFEASQGNWCDSILVSVQTDAHGFGDLVIEPELSSLLPDTVAPIEVLEALLRWSNARLVGPLISMRRNRVIERLAQLLFKKLCGEDWMRAEAAFLEGKSRSLSLRLERAVQGPDGFSSALAREYDRMEVGTASGKRWFTSVACRWSVCNLPEIPEFALQFASHPYEMPPVPKALLETWLTELKQQAILLRGARLVSLFAASTNPGPFGGIFPRWVW